MATIDPLDGGRLVGAELWEVDCLGPCELSNVVVVRSTERRRWFGENLASFVVTALAD